MLLLQHVFSLLITEDWEYSKKHLAAVLYPDAIRGFGCPRQCSHFETGDVNQRDVSYWDMPTSLGVDIDVIQTVLNNKSHLAEYRPCVIGELTDLNTFYEHSYYLPNEIKSGVEIHLRQDITFDLLVRDKIDCSRRHENVFLLDNKEIDGSEMRNVILQIENYGIICAAEKFYNKTGEIISNNWIKYNLIPILMESYPADLVKKTEKFLLLDTEYERLIQSKSWDIQNPKIMTKDEYTELYNKIGKAIEEVTIKEAN